MAYISNFTTQTFAANTALTLPPHEVDDIIVVFVSADQSATNTHAIIWGGTQTGGTNLAQVNCNTAGNGSSMVGYTKATGSAVTCTVNTADSTWVQMLILKDCDTTTWIDTTPTSSNPVAATEFTVPALSTTTTDCLVLYLISLDQVTQSAPTMAHSLPGPTATMMFGSWSNIDANTTVSTMTASAFGWYIQRSAGPVPRPVWNLGASEQVVMYTIAFRNKAGGRVPPYVDDSANLGTKLIGTHWWASATTRNNENFPTALTYTTNIGPAGIPTTAATGDGTSATLSFATKSFPPFTVGSSITVAGVTPAGYNGTFTVRACTPSSVTYANATTAAQTVAGTIAQTIAATYDAAAVIADAGLNPYSNALNSTPAASTTNAIGFQCNFPTTTIDMTTGWIVGSFMTSNSKMALYNQGTIQAGGTYLVVGQGANYRTFRIMAQDNADGNGVGFTTFSVRPNQTYSQYGFSATAPTITTIDKLLFLHRGQNAVGAFYYQDIHLIKVLTLAGGDANNPVDSQGVYDIGRFCRVPTIKKIGAAEILAYVPLRVGGGDAINFQISAGALQFPRISDTRFKEINYHGNIGDIGISYAGKSGDVIKHTDSIITSPSPYYWAIDAAATSAATWDFTGTTVVNAIVTLRPVITFNDMSFADCVSMDATATTVTNCNIGLDSTTSNPLTVSSTTSFSACAFNTTGISAGIGMVSLNLTTGVPFSNCTFTGSGTSGHAIIITQPGTYSFSGLTFNSYGGTPGDNLTPNSGSTSAAVYNNSGGAVIIQASGGTQPSVRNGASATTDVQLSADVIISGLVADSEVRAYVGTDPATAIEIAGTESSTGTTFTFTQSRSGQVGYIAIFHIEYQPLFLSYTYLSTNDTLTVRQITDRQYARGTTFAPN